jgi:hypothetical protein
MSNATTEPRSAASPCPPSPPDSVQATGGGDGGAGLIVAVLACEIAATVSVAVQGRPLLGLLFLGVGFAIACGWTRRYRRQANTRVRDQIESASRLLADGSHTAAWNTACAAAGAAGSQPLCNAALAVMVRVALEEKHYRIAREVWGRARPRRFADPCLEAALERADGGALRAALSLERARRRPTFDGAAARMLIELYAEMDQLEGAVRIAVEHLELLEGQEVRTMIGWLETWGEANQAKILAAALTKRTSAADHRLARQIA